MDEEDGQAYDLLYAPAYGYNGDRLDRKTPITYDEVRAKAKAAYENGVAQRAVKVVDPSAYDTLNGDTWPRFVKDPPARIWNRPSEKDRPQGISAHGRETGGTIPVSGDTAGASRDGQAEACFSPGSLERIEKALAAVEQKNPYFSCSLSPACISYREGYGQGIDINCSGGQYRCTYHRERSNDTETISTEEEAVRLFIRFGSHAKQDHHT